MPSKPINQRHSFKDYTGQDLSKLPVAEFNDSEIVGTCFAQESVLQAGLGAQSPAVDIFPVGMKGATFRRCNLCNVNIPPGNTVITDGWEACQALKIMLVGNEDWEVNKVTHAPIKKLSPTMVGV